MSGKLRVLVLESERGAADPAVAMLAGAGHEVVRCHEPGAPAFPCNALADPPDCPVRTGSVDVALTVRHRPRSQPAPHEDGVSCALERHVPLVVAGSPALNPFEPWAAEVIDGMSGVVDACERAAVSPLPRHAAAALAALDTVLATHEVDPGAHDVVVLRREGRLHVTVRSTAPVAPREKAMASVRIVAALRALDAESGGIDVGFEEFDEAAS